MSTKTLKTLQTLTRKGILKIPSAVSGLVQANKLQEGDFFIEKHFFRFFFTSEVKKVGKTVIITIMNRNCHIGE